MNRMVVSIFTIKPAKGGQAISTIEVRINKAYAAVNYNWKNRKPGFPFIGLIKATLKLLPLLYKERAGVRL